MRYEFQYCTFGVDAAEVCECWYTAEEAVAQIERIPAGDTLALVTAIEGRSEFGTMTIWANADRAYVQLVEQRTVIAIAPEVDTRDTDQEVSFRDEENRVRTTPLRHTLDRTRAFEALARWIPFQENHPDLTWIEA